MSVFQRIGAAILAFFTAIFANIFPWMGKDPDPTTTEPSTSVTETQVSETSTEQTSLTSSTEVSESPEVKQAREILGFSYDFQDECYYTVNDAWQRKFGYTAYYDVFAEMLVMYYDTVRIKFSYKDKDWMVQLWKGQYGLTFVGAEIGVYSKSPEQSAEFYECVNDETRLQIGYVCYSYNDILFTRSSQPTWWLTGFVPGKLDKFSDRSQLTLKINFTFKDNSMRDAFVNALLDPKCGFKEGGAAIPSKDKDTFFIAGKTVFLMWNTDRNEETIVF